VLLWRAGWRVWVEARGWTGSDGVAGGRGVFLRIGGWDVVGGVWDGLRMGMAMAEAEAEAEAGKKRAVWWIGA
jgi:hypothetical protein